MTDLESFLGTIDALRPGIQCLGRKTLSHHLLNFHHVDVGPYHISKTYGSDFCSGEVWDAPTTVRYTDPNGYRGQPPDRRYFDTRGQALDHIAGELAKAVQPEPPAEYEDDAPTVHLATMLRALVDACGYNDVLETLEGMKP